METPDYADRTARVLDGEAQHFGDLFWPRLDPPLLGERFGLLADALPPGTIAAGITAGWLWSGLGIPTPFGLIAKAQPAPSPLARHVWKIRGTSLTSDQVVVRNRVTCLTREATIDDLWTCDGPDEVAASQLFWLTSEEDATSLDPPASPRVIRRLRLVRRWRVAYPWATR